MMNPLDPIQSESAFYPSVIIHAEMKMNDEDGFDLISLGPGNRVRPRPAERNTIRRVLYLDWQTANVSIIARRLYSEMWEK